MSVNLHRRWFLLPILSGVLLVLTFHPFNVWPLGFVALAPLYYFVGGFPHTRWIVFWGGFIAGGIFSFCLSYYTIVQFHWLPEAYLFVGAVRLLVIPITLIGGVLCGVAMLCRALRGSSILRNALLAAALYTAAEILLGYIFGGYYLGLLAYAATELPFVLSVAALGGAHAVSFVLAFVSGYLAEACIVWRANRPAVLRAAVVALCLAALVLLPNWIYLHQALPTTQTFSVVLLQQGSRERMVFGKEHDGVFSWGMGGRLTDAASSSPDLVIYPFSPVEGALYRDTAPAFNKEVLVASEKSVARFLAEVMPARVPLMTWNNVYADGNFYNQYEVWQDGAVAAQYQKRALFAFMDYTPLWAQRIGLFSTPFDVVAGAQDNRLVLGDIALGGLMCSELHNTTLARAEARGAPLIIAVGSEAMFQDDVASAFSLKAAQLRAVENNVPVIRGNILGPSAIIDRFGSLSAFAPAGAEATIAADVALTAPRATLYNRLGGWLVALLICGILGNAWHTRSRAKTLL